MIPDEAVEAAAFELYKDDQWGKPTEWPAGPFADGLTLDEFKEDYRKLARAALEAAAPHMQELQWGVRDIVSLHIAGHPSEESARSIAAEHPQWYEVVSRPMPGLWTAK